MPKEFGVVQPHVRLRAWRLLPFENAHSRCARLLILSDQAASYTCMP